MKRNSTSNTALLIYGSSNLASNEIKLEPGDDAIRSRLESLGYLVSPCKHNEVSGNDISNCALVFISSLIGKSTLSESFKAYLPVSDKPVVVADEAALGEMGMTGKTANEHYGLASFKQRAVRIKMTASSHSLGAGLMDDIVAVEREDDAGKGRDEGPDDEMLPMVWGTPAPAAIRIATLVREERGGPAQAKPPAVATDAKGARPYQRAEDPKQAAASGGQEGSGEDQSKCVLFGYERGAHMFDRPARARRVAIFVNGGTAAHLTEDGWSLFDAAINWAVGEELKQFSEVFREEWQEIRERRLRQRIGTKPDGDVQAKGTVVPGAPPNNGGASHNGGGGRAGNGAPHAATASTDGGDRAAGGGNDSSWMEEAEAAEQPPDNLVGLALSGGGIRSATFCLGLLQGFNRRGMLRLFDYVSTVSGGGYLGSWWSAWLSRGGSNLQDKPLYPLFNSTDLKHSHKFIARLLSNDEEITQSKKVLYRYFNEKFSGDTVQRIRHYARRGGDLEQIKDYIVNELNALLKPDESTEEGDGNSPVCLYDHITVNNEPLAAAFDDCVSLETRVVVGHKDKLPNDELVCLNRLLLEEALCEELGTNVFPRDERIEPERSDVYFKERVLRERHRNSDAAVSGLQRLAEDRKFKEENSETAKELLCAGDDPIHHLRLFANYLTPRKGFLSADTWRAATVVTRNLVMTWLILLPIIFAAVLAGQVYFSLRPDSSEAKATYERLEAYAKPINEKWAHHDFIFPYGQSIVNINQNIAANEKSLRELREVKNPADPAGAALKESQLRQVRVWLEQQKDTAQKEYRRVLARRFWFALWPVSILLGWLVLLTSVWMLFNSGGIKGRNILSGAVVWLIVGLSVAAAWPQLWDWFLRPGAVFGSDYLGSLQLRHWIWIGVWLTGALGLCLWLRAKWKTLAHESEYVRRDERTSLQWRKDVLRTEIVRVKTLLLALMTVAIFVLALAGFGHDLLDYIFNSEEGWWPTFGRWFALVSTALTIAASIFTAVKGTPKGGGDTLADAEPSLTSRVIFAATPPAVLIVLMIAISWIAHWLLWVVCCRKLDSLVPLTFVTLIGITLCLYFAMVEVKWRRTTPRKWMRLWVVVSVGIGAALCVLALRNLMPDSHNWVEISRWYEHEWRDPAAWYLQRRTLLLPIILAACGILVRMVAKEAKEGKKGRLFFFAPLQLLLLKRQARPFLNRLELFGLSFLLFLIAAAGLFVIEEITGFIDKLIPTTNAFPDMTAPFLPGRLLPVSCFLTGVVLCWLLTLLEIRRGTGNNRRALILIAASCMALSFLLLISFVPSYTDKTSYALLGHSALVLLATALGWVVALGWLADPNTLSMHTFYKSRLVRAYLGASNPQRQLRPREVTEAVEGDDVLLSDLKNCQRGAPYHLINTTLNLAAGRDLTTTQRSSAMFVLSKLNCGSSRTGYRRTEKYMGGRLSLGTAVAASGAAASPNMGSRTPSASLAMLMTILNVRLGYWSPTPNKNHWQTTQPQLWPFYMLREFLSQTNDLSSYSYLTDGGHFDNTGLYSLIERGCRFIVVADCGADIKPCFSDLGDAIRRCRIDFGAEIKLNVDPFIKNEKGRATQHFIVGEIVYRKEHLRKLGWKPADIASKEKRHGRILIFKPSRVNDETADIRQYGLENRQFPQQSTADQWFDESQFESYRRLGQWCVHQLFEKMNGMTVLKGDRPVALQDIVKEGHPLSVKEIEKIFDTTFEKYRPPEMRSRVREEAKDRLKNCVKEEAERYSVKMTRGFEFYLNEMIDEGVSKIHLMDEFEDYLRTAEHNLRQFIEDMAKTAWQAGGSRLHEQAFFNVRGNYHIFPFAGSDGNGQK